MEKASTCVPGAEKEREKDDDMDSVGSAGTDVIGMTIEDE